MHEQEIYLLPLQLWRAALNTGGVLVQIIASVIVVVCVVVGLGVLGALLMRRRRAMQARHACAHWFHQLAAQRAQFKLPAAFSGKSPVRRCTAGSSAIFTIM